MAEILKIADLVADPCAPRWVEYPGLPGFEVHLRQPDIPAATRLVSQSATPMSTSAPPPPGKGKKALRKTTLEVDWINYHYALLRYAPDDWRGLKVKHLSQLTGLPVKTTGADPEADLAFCVENLDFLIRHAVEFSKWLSEVLNNWNEEIVTQEEKDKENLSLMPHTAPIH